jgi:hypothetical protein
VEGSEMEKGAQVTVIGFRGVELQRRVWEDVGLGVLVCAEDDYQRALEYGVEPPCAGFPKQDVFEASSGCVSERMGRQLGEAHRA